MKAAVRREYGDSDQINLETINIPVPKANQVLVKVHATTVNRTDCANLTAKPFIMRFVLGFSKPRKIVIGTDFSGEVMKVGEDVTSVKVGDRVFGFTDTGSQSQAEGVLVNEDDVFLIPKQLDYKNAAASLEGAHYAYTFIHKVNIQPGQKILINGATGAIGSALLQFVKQYDVQVTVTCNTKNIDLMKSLGADKVIDYTKADFTKDDDRYDFIFDSVGKSRLKKCKPLLKKKGIYISSELGPNAENVFYALVSPFMKNKVVFPVPYNKKKTIPYITKLLGAGKFKPVIDREFHLEKIAEAYDYVMKGQKTGNVVLTMV
ncbi:NAD(P)-dependent alcohol dehydrogenase [Fulvivirga ligni]|uniref:NAD(P)-dependent alcohol dehydrogenase n=1 Tax=Fulvivirga ligni TaxID=2904246 RepID=UPI001F3F64F8|nr:NAD(P)-dependent alcohol dehydrogenase [Fulvivirga ligni]UII20100.1 NAD(P)-dependent alcohol dehydrogenase [Fulvivirga ligni]